MVGGFLSLMLGAGCASSGGKGAQSNARDKDRVLLEYRKASEMIQAKRFPEAKAALDPALETLGGISAGDRSARKARGLFRSEDTKTFRGEPYERVMAYYYRGILYWMDGELDNARACFRSAQLQDADAEKNQYQSDYVLLDYLDGLITAKLHGDGSDAFRRAGAVARLAKPPNPDPSANVIVFAEMGRGPSKTAAGQYGEHLQYVPGSARAVSARLRLGAQTTAIPGYDDLTYQATTRGGRVMDRILANKAGFKEGTDTFGNAALISGAALGIGGSGSHSAADEVGAGLLVAGLISKIISSATTPHADTRTWDNLPNLLAFGAMAVPPGQHQATVEFLDGAGRVVSSQPLSLTVVAGRDTVVLVSDRN